MQGHAVHALAHGAWLVASIMPQLFPHLQLLLLYIVIFFILVTPRKTLPGKRSSQKVEQNVPNGLEIVPA